MALEFQLRTNSMSWVFREEDKNPRIVLRQPGKTGPRFDVARLLGDRLFTQSEFTPEEPLSPATRSYSYRQKAQRAFATELLSPWEAMRDTLKDDPSPENQEQVAGHFSVPPLSLSVMPARQEDWAHARPTSGIGQGQPHRYDKGPRSNGHVQDCRCRRKTLARPRPRQYDLSVHTSDRLLQLPSGIPSICPAATTAGRCVFGLQASVPQVRGKKDARPALGKIRRSRKPYARGLDYGQ